MTIQDEAKLVSMAGGRPKAGAARTCTACKDRKRKCSRQLPACDFCRRKKVQCDYTVSDKVQMHFNVLNTSSKLFLGNPSDPVEPSRFPAIFFLDSKLFNQSQIGVPQQGLPVPPLVTRTIGLSDEIKDVAAKYFESIHLWLPFISKKRFYQNLLSPLSQPRADVALLLLCMKLIVWSPPKHGAIEDPVTLLYSLAKRYVLEVETAGILSVPAVQACILLTVYEIGHAIYPSGYLSIGTCARYVMALGLDGKAAPPSSNPSIWVQQEEKRRIWWAVVILERFANLGFTGSGLSTPDPSTDDILPTDDTAWDEGIIARNDFTVFSPTDVNMGMFARFAQATNLLSQVQRHKCRDNTDRGFRAEEAIQLDRTIRSLISLVEHEGQIRRTSVCLQTAVCYSALMVLHDEDSLIARKALCEEMIIIARSFLARLTQNPDTYENVSPLLLNWAYQAANTYVMLYLETADDEYLQCWSILEETLKVLNKRWRVAGAYLQILELRNSREIS